MIKFIFILLELFLTFWMVGLAVYVNNTELSHEDYRGSQMALFIMLLLWTLLLNIIIRM